MPKKIHQPAWACSRRQPIKSSDNFDALTNDPHKNAKLTASAVSYYIGYMIHNKE
jgi:hypothetical protein